MKRIILVFILIFSVISISVGCIKTDTKKRNIRVTSTTASVTRPAWMEEETLENEASRCD